MTELLRARARMRLAALHKRGIRRLLEKFLDSIPVRQSPERLRVQKNAKIYHLLRRHQMRLLPIDDDSQRLTKMKNRIQCRHDLRTRCRLDQPIVQVATDADTGTMEESQDRSHDPGKNLRSHGETKAQSLELVHLAKSYESEILPAVRMNQNLQVGILQVSLLN